MCALDEVQVTFACIGHPSGTTVTIIIQVCNPINSPLVCASSSMLSQVMYLLSALPQELLATSYMTGGTAIKLPCNTTYDYYAT